MRAKNLFFLIVILSIVLLPVIFFPTSEVLTSYIDNSLSILNKRSPSSTNDIGLSALGTILYGTIGAIANGNIFILRGVEFVIHLLTSISLFFLAKKYLSQSKAALASIVYAMSIVLLNYKFSFHIEPLSNILIIALITLHLKASNNSKEYISKFKPHIWVFILEGILLSILIAIKFNFIFLIIGILIFDIFHQEYNWQAIAKKYSTIFCGMIIFFGFYWLLIITLGSPTSFDWILGSVKRPTVSYTFIRDFLKNITLYFAHIYSILLIIALFYSIFNWIKNISNNSINTDQSNLFGISFYLAMAIILLYVLNADFPINQVALLYIPFSIFIANGLVEIYYRLKNLWNVSSISSRVIYSAFVNFLLLFSPIIFWFYYMQYPFIYIIFHNHAVLL